MLFLWLPVFAQSWPGQLHWHTSLWFTTWSWPLQNASITLASASLDISSGPLTPFPAPTLTPQPLFWPVCWTHQGLGVGQWSLQVKSEHYWVSDMYDSTHKCAYTHMCTHMHVHTELLALLCQMLGLFSVTNLFSKEPENVPRCAACLLPVTAMRPRANLITSQMSHLEYEEGDIDSWRYDN